MGILSNLKLILILKLLRILFLTMPLCVKIWNLLIIGLNKYRRYEDNIGELFQVYFTI